MRIHVQNEHRHAENAVGPEHWREAAARAGAIGAGHEVSFGDAPEALAAALPEVELLVTSSGVLRRAFPAEAPRLKTIFLTHAGIDSLPAPDLLPSGVTVLNNSGVHGDKAGEYAVMAVLMLANHLALFIGQQQRGIWERRPASVLAGRRATVVGLGSLGTGAARRLRWFGMEITGVRAHARAHAECGRVVATAEFDAVLPDTEFLFLACPLTPDTREILDRRRIGLLPPGAGVVNVGRGELIEQDALLDALDAGHLSGAVLDVFVPEPVPPGHRLWRTPNLVMTPHMSAGDPRTYAALSLDILFKNLAALARGEAPPNQVDRARGY